MKTKTNAVLMVVALLAFWVGLCNASAFYDPGTQRWLNRDPIEESGSFNMFRFVANTPLNLVDAFGLKQTHVPTYNGCGAEGSSVKPPDSFGLWDFGPACNGHDICYGTCGSKKSKCDSDFLQNMLDVCSAYSYLPILQQSCEKLAFTYYSAVAIGGKGAFDSAQDDACCPEKRHHHSPPSHGGHGGGGSPITLLQ